VAFAKAGASSQARSVCCRFLLEFSTASAKLVAGYDEHTHTRESTRMHNPEATTRLDGSVSSTHRAFATVHRTTISRRITP